MIRYNYMKKKYSICSRTTKGIMYMWKHFLLMNKVGAALAELIYEHLP